jgi:hypothetical protein
MPQLRIKARAQELQNISDQLLSIVRKPEEAERDLLLWELT